MASTPTLCSDRQARPHEPPTVAWWRCGGPRPRSQTRPLREVIRRQEDQIMRSTPSGGTTPGEPRGVVSNSTRPGGTNRGTSISTSTAPNWRTFRNSFLTAIDGFGTGCAPVSVRQRPSPRPSAWRATSAKDRIEARLRRAAGGDDARRRFRPGPAGGRRPALLGVRAASRWPTSCATTITPAYHFRADADAAAVAARLVADFGRPALAACYSASILCPPDDFGASRVGRISNSVKMASNSPAED